MNRQALLACIRKEILLLRRDKHGLALLFIMPIAFILVMSLALQDEFAARAGKKIAVLAVDRDASAASRQLLARLSDSGAFAVQLRADAPAQDLDQIVLAERYAFAVDIAAGYGEQLSAPPATGAAAAVTLVVAPDTGKQTEMIFRAALREALGRQRVNVLLDAVRDALPDAGSALSDTALEQSLAVHYAARAGAATGRAPSAVQQSVPAWLVFAVFFVAIPLSNTLIRERQLGTLRRLRSTNVGGFTLLAGKWLTFFIVNQVQVVLMLLVGVYLVPALGGEALQLRGSMAALAVIAGALSVAALGYALLIAAVARTTEQATLLGGAGNIILAALGGIMVPKFIMPAAMQTATNLSPMAWGLEGFLDVLLRGGTCADLWPKAAALIAFGAAALTAAWLLQRRQQE
jgi:ABC-2 type transport system permease protein